MSAGGVEQDGSGRWLDHWGQPYKFHVYALRLDGDSADERERYFYTRATAVAFAAMWSKQGYETDVTELLAGAR